MYVYICLRSGFVYNKPDLAYYAYCLVPVILASAVRFHPYSPHQRTICMRVEVYGCRADGELDPQITIIQRSAFSGG